MKGMTPKQLLEKVDSLKPRRYNFESIWQDVGDYLIPRKNDIQVTKYPGEARYVQLLDATGMTNSELLAGTLHSFLTNPAGFFFNMSTGDAELDGNDNVRMWVQEVVRRMHDTLNNSNFQTELHEYYIDLINFGTSTLSIEEDVEQVVRFASRPVKEVYIEENSKGIVDCLYRCYEMDCRSLVDEFGYENLPERVQKKYDANKPDRYKVLHAIYPSKKMGKSVKYTHAFTSQHVLVEEKVTLAVKGFREFPYVVSRWSKASGEEYGRGPGEKALPNVKMLNKIMETTIKGAQKTVDPPLQAPDDGFMLPLVTRPGGFNYYRAGSEDRIQPIYNDARVDFGFQMIELVSAKIREAFYVDQLKLREGPQMTATEVSERIEQAFRFLGPIFGRQQAEFLQPTIERLYKIMDRRDMFPPAPAELEGIPLKIQYSSVMALSQRQSEVQNIQRTMAAITPFASADPGVLDIFNGDKMAKYIAKLYNYPQEGIRTDDELQQLREQRQQAQQQMMENAQAAQNVDTASKLMNAAGKVAKPA